MSKSRYIAVDLGAESGRTMLGTLDNRRFEIEEIHRFVNIPVHLPTGLHWDTLGIFSQICTGLRMTRQTGGSIDGVAIDSWGVDFGLLDKNGALLEHPRHYRDERTQGVPEQVFEIVPRSEVFRQTGVQVMELNSLYQLYSIHKRSPWVLEHASKLLFIPDLMTYFLSGAQYSERSIASTSQFYDPSKGSFADEILRELGIPTRILPDLLESGACVGPLSRRMIEQSGLRDANVYMTAGHDTASAVAAVPADPASSWCFVSSGTWSLIGVELDSPIINERSLTANFTNEVGAGGRIRFLKNMVGLWLLQECRRAWAQEGCNYSYDELMREAACARPSKTIIDPDAFHTPGHHPDRIREYCRKTDQEVPEDVGSICRVILYSLAVRCCKVIHDLEELTNRQIDVIHIVGGGARNTLLNQTVADVSSRRVIAGPTEATAIGNALVQAWGRGDVTSLEELRSIVGSSFEVRTFLPLC